MPNKRIFIESKIKHSKLIKDKQVLMDETKQRDSRSRSNTKTKILYVPQNAAENGNMVS